MTPDKLLKLVKLALASYRMAVMVATEDGPLDVFHKLRMRAAVARAEAIYVDRTENDSGTVTMRFVHAPSYRFLDSVHRLIKCPFCLGVWFAALVMIMPGRVVDWLAVAGLQHMVMQAMEERG